MTLRSAPYVTLPSPRQKNQFAIQDGGEIQAGVELQRLEGPCRARWQLELAGRLLRQSTDFCQREGGRHFGLGRFSAE
jgi:hypothetical protein